MPPNILFLSVDALRADRLGCYGYQRPTSPNIDRFAARATTCTQAFSLGPFTQSAFVQMMTSSRALSYGGYDNGATGRPTNLFEHFHDAGYQTTALSTLHWVNSYFGYGEGIDEEWQLFTINTVMGVAIANMRNSLRGYIDGSLTSEEAMKVIGDVVPRAFTNIEDYARRRLNVSEEIRTAFPYAQLVRSGFDYHKIIKSVERHRSEFNAAPWQYVERHLIPVPEAHTWLAKEWRYARSLKALAEEAIVRMLSKVAKPFAPHWANNIRYRNRSYVDAASLADKTIALLRDRANGKAEQNPFFLWCHFMDTHLPYVSGRGLNWYRETPKYLQAVGHAPDIEAGLTFQRSRLQSTDGMKKASALYDAALRWTDEQIGRIFDALDETGLSENTIVVLVGDHGEEFGENGFVGHYFLPTEGNVHVPMMFFVPGATGQRCENLVSLLDVAPTLSHLANLAPDPQWEGAHILSKDAESRDRLIMETFFGGNCIFEHRALYLGVRTRGCKYVWKEFRDPADRYTADGNLLFDLNTDPGERHNIYRDDHPDVADLEQTLALRVAEIPEISDARIVKCFGDRGREAIRAVRQRDVDEDATC